MNGKLYGIGVGPGDPELLTIKAIRTIERCDVIAIPSSESPDRTAFAIVEKYLTGKIRIDCKFSMSHDEEKRKQQRQTVTDEICEHLADGKTVGFITLGDPAIYSTYAYIHEHVAGKGFATEIIPGVTSFSAAAAAMNVPLCRGSQMLHLIPAVCETSLEILDRLPGTKVVMKSGKNMKQVLHTLQQNDLTDQTKVVVRASMDGEQVFDCTEVIDRAEQIGYFTLVIVMEKES